MTEGGSVDHLLELGSSMSRFAELASRADGTEPVEACPGWTMRDLTEHLGTIHRWATGIVISGQRIDQPEVIVTEPIVQWYAGTATALLATLQAVDPIEPTPNFSRLNESASFWSRRQMHETVVHTVDASQALGEPESEWTVPASVASDGIDEVLTVFFPRMTARGTCPDVRSKVRLVATDLSESWVVGPGSTEGSPPTYLHSSVESDTEVTGTASDLYLALWGRVSLDRLTYASDDGRALFAGPTTP